MKKRRKTSQFKEELELTLAIGLAALWFLSLVPFLMIIGLYCELRYGLTDKADDMTWKWSTYAWDKVVGFIPRLIFRAFNHFKSTAPCY